MERPSVDDGPAARPETEVDHARTTREKERDEQDLVDAKEGTQETVVAASSEPTAESAEGEQTADAKAKLAAGDGGNEQPDQAAVDQTKGDAESARSSSTAASDAPGSTTVGVANAPGETEDSAISGGQAEGTTADPQVEKAGHVDLNGQAAGETERTVDATTPQLTSGFTGEAGEPEDGDGQATGAGTTTSETPRGEKGAESSDSASDRRTDRSRSTAGKSPQGGRSSDPANVQQMTTKPADSQGASSQLTSLQGATVGNNGSAGGAPDPPDGPTPAGNTRSPVQPVGPLLRSEATRPQASAAGNAVPDTAAGNVDHVRFVQRVARALQMGRSQPGELQLRLNPPELGRLNLEVSIKQGVLTARLEAETDAARSLILDNLPALRDRLAEQNIRIERFHVDLMAPSSDGSQGEIDYRDARQGHQGQRPAGGTRSADREADPRPTTQRGMPDIDGNLNVIV